MESWVLPETLEDLTKKPQFQAAQEDGVLKACLVGDGAVGKTIFTLRAHGLLDDEKAVDYVPTVLDFSCSTWDVNGETIQIALLDTASRSDYDYIRPVEQSFAFVFGSCSFFLSLLTLF